jgi:hypothetical protein
LINIWLHSIGFTSNLLGGWLTYQWAIYGEKAEGRSGGTTMEHVQPAFSGTNM